MKERLKKKSRFPVYDVPNGNRSSLFKFPAIELIPGLSLLSLFPQPKLRFYGWSVDFTSKWYAVFVNVNIQLKFPECFGPW